MKDMNSAIILAAGLGTRLKSLTHSKPKALMPIAGEAAISHVIRQLVSQGIHNIAINIHHHADQLRRYLGNGSQFNANLYFSYEPELLNSGGGVRTALELLPHSELVAVYNADIMSHINLKQLSNSCPQGGCSLALVPNPKHNLKGDFSLGNGRVSNTERNSYTFSGVSVWSTEALSEHPINTAFPLTKPIQQLLVKKQCFGSVYHGQWFDIGRPRDLIQANRLLNKEVL